MFWGRDQRLLRYHPQDENAGRAAPPLSSVKRRRQFRRLFMRRSRWSWWRIPLSGLFIPSSYLGCGQVVIVGTVVSSLQHCFSWFAWYCAGGEFSRTRSWFRRSKDGDSIPRGANLWQPPKTAPWHFLLSRAALLQQAGLNEWMWVAHMTCTYDHMRLFVFSSIWQQNCI